MGNVVLLFSMTSSNLYLNANTICLKTVDEEYSLLLIGVHYINDSHLIHLGVVENNEMLNY
jgi:hypothetical protein